MYEDFGAAVSGDQVEFRLFLPDNNVDPKQYDRGGTPRIASVKVLGDFQANPWDLASAPQLTPTDHSSGTLYVHTVSGLQERFYEYKYYVTFENQTSRWCTDPCTKYVGRSNQNAGFVVGGNRIEHVAPNSSPRALAYLVVYELMIDDFTADYRGNRAPIDAVLDKLDQLLDLGVNAIEFMPWTAWRDEAFSWGYNPYLFFSVENRYIENPSEPADRLFRLQRLVETLHQRGVGVIMDGVFNHVDAGHTPDTGFPYFWLYQDPKDSPYIGRFADAQCFEDIDFANPCAQEFITDVCKFWLDRYQLDGIRFDYVRGFFKPDDPQHGITRLVQDLKKHLADQSRDHVALILEDLPDNRYQAIDDTNRIGADASWYDRFHFDIPEAAERNSVSPELIRVLNTGLDFAPGKLPVVYCENHDHRSVVNRVGGRNLWYRTQAPAIALFTSPGVVMLHNGQEIGIDVWMPDEGAGRVIPRPIDWTLADDAVGSTLFDLYRRLAQIRATYASLQTTNFYPWPYDAQARRFNDQGYGVDADRRVVIFHRWGILDGGALERMIVALNFSPFDQAVDVPFSLPGHWTELLDSADVDISGFVARGVRLPSNWGRVYAHTSPP